MGRMRSQAAAKPRVETGSSSLILSKDCASCGRNVWDASVIAYTPVASKKTTASELKGPQSPSLKALAIGYSSESIGGSSYGHSE